MSRRQYLRKWRTWANKNPTRYLEKLLEWDIRAYRRQSRLFYSNYKPENNAPLLEWCKAQPLIKEHGGAIIVNPITFQGI